MKKIVLTLTAIVSLNCYAQKDYEYNIPAQTPPYELKGRHSMDYHGKLEISGIVQSAYSDSVYWVHSDSDNGPRLFPVDSMLNIYESSRFFNHEGVWVNNATNVDWEDITRMGDDLILADFGNNGNDRRDLCLYFIKEPPVRAGLTNAYKTVYFKYPDQKAFPDRKAVNYDAEAIFNFHGKIYILTKHRSDTYTRLYRLDTLRLNEINTLTLIAEANLRGKVTGAEMSPDGKKLAVITYQSVWLFTLKDENSDNFFEGNVSWLPVMGNQIESVCFANPETLLIIDELEARLFRLPIKLLLPVNR